MSILAFHLWSSFLLWGELPGSRGSAAEPEDWCLSAEAEQWYDMRSYVVTLNRDTQRDSCHQTLEPVYQRPAETRGWGPPRHAHMHMVSNTCIRSHSKRCLIMYVKQMQSKDRYIHTWNTVNGQIKESCVIKVLKQRSKRRKVKLSNCTVVQNAIYALFAWD